MGETFRICQHFWRTVERNGKWVTECEKCGQPAPPELQAGNVPAGTLALL